MIHWSATPNASSTTCWTASSPRVQSGRSTVSSSRMEPWTLGHRRATLRNGRNARSGIRSVSGLFDAKARRAAMARDIEEIAVQPLRTGITRLSFTTEYRGSPLLPRQRFEAIGFGVAYDPVGNFIASNVSSGERCVALGSHVDSVPHGGRFDGTAGVLCALEVARNIPTVPLKVFSFVEEEGARFGSGLLGSRCVAELVSAEELGEYCDEEGVSFHEAAREAGFSPDEASE